MPIVDQAAIARLTAGQEGLPLVVVAREGYLLGIWRYRRRFALFLCSVLIGLTGCFGPQFMANDIRSYNQETLNSETEMLLDNVGRLSEHQPPHFMMLATVSQTRTFSASAGFQWMQTLAAINPITAIARTLSPGNTITTTYSNIGRGNTWSAGPFTTTTVENPTIAFIPIQGQEFFNRFESPMTERFTYFFQEQIRDRPNRNDLRYLIKLSAESLRLYHGDTDGVGSCPEGFYLNRAISASEERQGVHGVGDFSNCLDEIVPSKIDLSLPLSLQQIDGHHLVPTDTSEDPKAADVINALDKNYEWIKNGNRFVLTTPIRIPAIFDYGANFKAAPAPQPKLDPALILYHGSKGPYETQPGPLDLVYGTPKGYSWKQYYNRGKPSYALVPEGYGVDENDNTLVKFDKCGKKECASDSGTCEGGTCEKGRCVQKMCQQCEKGQCPEDKTRLLYADDIIEDVWPVQRDYVYIELRRNNQKKLLSPVDVFNNTAKSVCIDLDKKVEAGNLVCGFLKIGNLLQIMQRVADNAKACEVANHNPDDPACKASYFGIGSIPSPLADRSALIGKATFIWEPFHNPGSDLWQRDREAFAELYKLYQMSLVNTSQLVTSVPPITISK